MLEGWSTHALQRVEVLTEICLGLICLLGSILIVAAIDYLSTGRTTVRKSRAEQIEECRQFVMSAEYEPTPVDDVADGTPGCGNAIERSQAVY